MENLSPRQADCLEVIKNFTKSNGYTPTIREIMERMNVTSSSTVFGYMKALQKKGFIRRKHREVRFQLINDTVTQQLQADKDWIGNIVNTLVDPKCRDDRFHSLTIEGADMIAARLLEIADRL